MYTEHSVQAYYSLFNWHTGTVYNDQFIEHNIIRGDIL